MQSVDGQPWLRSYGVAMVAVVVAITLRFALGPLLGSEHPHTLTLGAVVLAVRYGGRGPGIAAAAVGWLAAHVLFAGDAPTGTMQGVAAGMYGLSAAAIIGVGGALRRSMGKAERDARRVAEQVRDLEREVAERRANQRATLERCERLQRLVDTVPTLLWTSDARGKCTFVNDEWLSFTGLGRDALLGDGWLQSIHADDREHVVDTLASATEHRQPFVLLYRMRHRDGTYRRMTHRGRPCLLGDELTGYTGSLADVTEEKVAEEALREADRRKDEFLATLAHELRNPLAPISNAVQILQAPDASEAMRESACGMIDRQVRQLTRLVDDLLDVSRIALGRLLVETKETTLGEVIETAVDASRPVIEALHHTLSIVLPTEPVQVEADSTRLTQVFVNLLNNAAKYTPSGGRISLIAAREGETVVVRVKDTGIGISPEVLPRIFDIFVRVDHSAQRAQAGLGIGLALVRHLVELHGGHIEARSEGPGRGSEFIVTLPVARSVAAAAPAEAPEAERARERALRILIVDDNAEAAESLRVFLRAAGHETYIVHDSSQAIEASTQLHPDIVILDVGLSSVDGYEVARAIRARGDGHRPRIIAVAGRAHEKNERRAGEAGFDKLLTKPVDPVVLTRLVEQADAGRWSRRI